MGGDGGIDQIAAEAPEARERAILVSSRKTRIADNVGDQDRRQFPSLAHGVSAGAARSPFANGLSMVHYHAAPRRTWKQGVQALRVDRPVYPRRVEYSTLVKGGIENWARLARHDPLTDSCPSAASGRPPRRSPLPDGAARRDDQTNRSPSAVVLASYMVEPNGSVSAMASNAAWVMEIWIKGRAGPSRSSARRKRR